MTSLEAAISRYARSISPVSGSGALSISAAAAGASGKR